MSIKTASCVRYHFKIDKYFLTSKVGKYFVKIVGSFVISLLATGTEVRKYVNIKTISPQFLRRSSARGGRDKGAGAAGHVLETLSYNGRRKRTDAVIALEARLTYDLQNLHTIIRNVGQGSGPRCHALLPMLSC